MQFLFLVVGTLLSADQCSSAPFAVFADPIARVRPGPEVGAVWLIDKTNGAVYSKTMGREAGDRFGDDLHIVSDLDGDQIADVVVQVDPWQGSSYFRVLSGSTGMELCSIPSESVETSPGVCTVPSGAGDGHSELCFIRRDQDRQDILVCWSITNGSVVSQSRVSVHERVMNFGWAPGVPGEAGDALWFTTGSGLRENGLSSDKNERDSRRIFMLDLNTGRRRWTSTPTDSNEYFGYIVIPSRAVSADGAGSLLVACPGRHGTSSGAIVRLSTADGSVVQRWPVGSRNYTFGSSLAEVSDMNDDGVPEIVVGAPRSLESQIYVLSGLVDTQLSTYASDSMDEIQWGARVRNAGDWDSDGFDDIAIFSTTLDIPAFRFEVMRVLSVKRGAYLREWTQKSLDR